MLPGAHELCEQPWSSTVTVKRRSITSFNEGGCSNQQLMDPDELKAQQEAIRAARNAKLQEDIEKGKHRQDAGESRQTRHLAQTDVIPEPSPGKLRDESYEENARGVLKHQKGQLAGQLEETAGLEQEMKARLALLQQTSAEAQAERIPMAGGEMESPWTGIPE